MPSKNKPHQKTEKDLAHSTIQLTHEVSKLTKEVDNLKSLEFIKVFRHPWKFMWFSFLKGMMVGFGSMLGASVLVGIFIYLLAQIKLVPYLGEFVEDIIDEIQIEKQIEKNPESTNLQENFNPESSENPETNNPQNQKENSSPLKSVE